MTAPSTGPVQWQLAWPGFVKRMVEFEDQDSGAFLLRGAHGRHQKTTSRPNESPHQRAVSEGYQQAGEGS